MMAETVHCVKSNTEFFSRPYGPVLSPNTGKYGPEKTTFPVVNRVGCNACNDRDNSFNFDIVGTGM